MDVHVPFAVTVALRLRVIALAAECAPSPTLIRIRDSQIRQRDVGHIKLFLRAAHVLNWNHWIRTSLPPACRGVFEPGQTSPGVL